MLNSIIIIKFTYSNEHNKLIEVTVVLEGIE